MLHKQFNIAYTHSTPEQWQKLMLQGQVETFVDLMKLFQYVDLQTGELSYEGPETVTMVLKNPGSDGERQ